MPVAPALTCRRKIGAERPAGAALRILVVFSFGISQNRSGIRRANRERRHSITEAVLSRKPPYGAPARRWRGDDDQADGSCAAAHGFDGDFDSVGTSRQGRAFGDQARAAGGVGHGDSERCPCRAVAGSAGFSLLCVRSPVKRTSSGPCERPLIMSTALSNARVPSATGCEQRSHAVQRAESRRSARDLQKVAPIGRVRHRFSFRTGPEAGSGGSTPSDAVWRGSVERSVGHGAFGVGGRAGAEEEAAFLK
jgi:hypothetical protein